MMPDEKLKRMRLWEFRDDPRGLEAELKRRAAEIEKRQAIEVEEMLKEKRKKYGNLPHLMRP